MFTIITQNKIEKNKMRKYLSYCSEIFWNFYLCDSVHERFSIYFQSGILFIGPRINPIYGYKFDVKIKDNMTQFMEWITKFDLPSKEKIHSSPVFKPKFNDPNLDNNDNQYNRVKDFRIMIFDGYHRPMHTKIWEDNRVITYCTQTYHYLIQRMSEDKITIYYNAKIRPRLLEYYRKKEKIYKQHGWWLGHYEFVNYNGLSIYSF